MAENRGHLRFQILRKLGSGSEGEVHEALDRWTGRPVCLKQVHGQGSESSLKQEASLLSTLSSRCFPAFLELLPGNAQSPATLILERKAGAPPERGEHNPMRIRYWLLQLLQGLAELEAKGMCHGDISRGNVLVSEDRAALIDLGLARKLDSQDIVRSGTLETMAPEVLEHGKPGPRSDVYSLAVLAYQLLEGRHPFSDDPEEALEAMQENRLRKSDKADDWLLRALSRDPENRPSSREWFQHLLSSTPKEKAARLAPLRISLPLDEEVQEELHAKLDESNQAWLLASSGSHWQFQLESLLLERSIQGELWTRIDLQADGSLRNWAGCFLQEPARLSAYPLLATTLIGKGSKRVLARQLIKFIDDQFDQPNQSFCLLLPTSLKAELVEELQAFSRQCTLLGRKLLLLQVGSSRQRKDILQVSASRMKGADQQVLEDALHNLPGCGLEKSAAASLLESCSGDSGLLPDAIGLNLRRGRLTPLHGEWAPSETLLRLGEQKLDLDQLDEDERLTLALCAAWKKEATTSLWQRLVFKGRETLIYQLEASGWLRDRGDGCLKPVLRLDGKGGRKGLKAAEQRLANHTLFTSMFDAEPTLVDLCLLHLLDCSPGDVPEDLAAHVLLHSSGGSHPEQRIDWIRKLVSSTEGSNQAALLNLLVGALMEIDQLQDALQELRRLIALDMLDARKLQVRRVYLHRRLGRYRLVRRLLNILRKNVNSPVEWLEFQALAVDNELAEGATKGTREALKDGLLLLDGLETELDAGMANACNNMGVAAFRLHDFEQAQKFWNKMDRHGRQMLNPRQRVWLANNLGVVHMMSGRLEQARREITQAGRTASAFHLDHDELMARTNLSLVQIRQGNPDLALRELEAARVQAQRLERPDMELALLNHRGEAYAAIGMLDQADRTWEEEVEMALSLDMQDECAEPLLQRLQLRFDLDISIEQVLLDKLSLLDSDPASKSRWELLSSWQMQDKSAVSKLKQRHSSYAGSHQELSTLLLKIRSGKDAPTEEVRNLFHELADEGEGLRHSMRLIGRDLDWWLRLKGGISFNLAPGILQRLRLQILKTAWLLADRQGLAACQSTGKALELLQEILEDLPAEWLQRLESSLLLERLKEQAESCSKWLDEQESGFERTH